MAASIAGHLGDPFAAAIVREHAELIAGYATAGARQVGLEGAAFTLVLSGGVLRHHCSDLFDGIAREVAAGRVVRSTVEPVFGALLMAYDAAGLRPGIEELGRTGPPPGFFRTL